MVQGSVCLYGWLCSPEHEKSSPWPTTYCFSKQEQSSRLIKGLQSSLCWAILRFKGIKTSKKPLSHCIIASNLLLRLERNRAEQKAFKTKLPC